MGSPIFLAVVSCQYKYLMALRYYGRVIVPTFEIPKRDVDTCKRAHEDRATTVKSHSP